MDLSKYPLEKFFFFVAGIIPGFVALLIFQLAAPGSFAWFFSLGFLGYKTKLGVILLAAFVIGNSLTTFLNSLLGAMGGALGGMMVTQPYSPSYLLQTAPWRDLRWRFALKTYLHGEVPNNTIPMADEVFNLKRETINLLPEADRPKALVDLGNERYATQFDDLQWSQWYDHYHGLVLFGRSKWEPQQHVMHGLVFNLETTAVYVLFSALVVSSVRHWWCLAPASFWLLILVAQQYDSLRKFRDPWASLSDQIEYLSESNPSNEPAMSPPK
jgi:hypothetical protein